MAKIGVITYSDTNDNYGQVLQYLAIHEYLKHRGHEPFLLRYMPPKRSCARRVLSQIYHSFFKPTKTVRKQKNELMELYDKWSDWSERNDKLHPRNFEEFRKQFFNLKVLFGFRDSQIQELDAYAIGSDQIWSFVGQWAFLGFVPKGKPRFSIAPSTGNKTFTTDQVQKAAEMLKDFSFVTCREDSGLEFCKKAGYEKAEKILDPTFLIDKTCYERYEKKGMKFESPYIFVYMLGAECEADIVDVSRFAQQHSLEVKYVASQGREDSYEKIWATVPEWISLMKGASYVITNSYHGMALSIIFQKQFLVLPVIGITSFMNERIVSLANFFSLKNRIYTDSLEQVLKPIDYSPINGLISANKTILDKKMAEIEY